MKKTMLVVLGVLALMLVGCKTVTPGHATSNPIGAKTGEASGKLLFGYLQVSNIDIGILTAAKKAGITKISVVDHKAEKGFLFTTVTTVVNGD